MWQEVAYGILIALIFISLIVLFVILFFKMHLHKITEYRRILFEKELEYQKNLNQTILETQEEIFDNLSQELHDDLGQKLTVINFQLEKLKLDQSDFEPCMHNLTQSVKEVSYTIRNLSHKLNNQLLTQSTLVTLIENEVSRLQQNQLIGIRFTCIGEKNHPFELNEKIVLFRIFQEILNNILKHAQATQIGIELKTQPKVTLRMEDNGLGFDLDDTLKNQKSIGLFNLIKRSEIIGYKASIQTEKGKGTEIVITQNTK